MKRCPVAGRPDWRAPLRAKGCTWHDDGEDGCWREHAVWMLSPDEILRLKQAAAEVAGLYDRALNHVAERNLWARFGFAPEAASILSASLQRADAAMLGRFDFLMDAAGQPRLLEFNADNALSLLETAVLQREWQQAVMPEYAQWNDLHESLVNAWRTRGVRTVHCAWRPRHAEVEGTARYIAGVIREAGLEAKLTALHCIGWHRQRGAFVDSDGQDIECCWKIYPWEWMLREPFARHMESSPCRFVEPPWRLLSGHKGLLCLLWALFPGHPALLPCTATEPPGNGSGAWVAKPALGREGGNVRILSGGELLEETGGDFGGQSCIYQEFVDAPAQDGFRPQFGVWMVGTEPVALGIRETSGRIITGDNPFVPHVISPRAG